MNQNQFIIASITTLAVVFTYRAFKRKNKINNSHNVSKEHEEFLLFAKSKGDIIQTLSINQQLKLYGLYKQAIEGNAKDSKVSKPMLNPAAIKKFNAWSLLDGMQQNDAKNEYMSFFMQNKQNEQSEEEEEEETGQKQFGFMQKVSTIGNNFIDEHQYFKNQQNQQKQLEENLNKESSELIQNIGDKLFALSKDSENNFDIFKTLFEKEVNADILKYEDNRGIPLLHSSIEGENEKLFNYLVQFYKQFNLIDLRESKSNMSALEFALLNDNMYFVKTLIGNGANMEGLEDIADKSQLEQIKQFK